MNATSWLPLPPYYDAANARRWDYNPDQTAPRAHSTWAAATARAR